MNAPIDTVAFRGHVEVGANRAGWPFARLTCNSEHLSLRSFARYDFHPDQVVAIEAFTLLPLLSAGLRIRHNRLDYPERIVFRRMGSRERVPGAIRHAGFIPSGKAVERPGERPSWMSILAWIVVPIAFGLLILLQVH